MYAHLVWGKQCESKENYSVVVLVSFLMSHFYFLGLVSYTCTQLVLNPLPYTPLGIYKGRRCQFSYSSLVMCLCFLVEYLVYLCLKANHRTQMGKK